MHSNDNNDVRYEAVLRRVLTAASQVFGRPVEASDNFFDLGGDSIAAVELCVLLESDLGVDLDVTDLIATEDLAELAKVLST